MCVCVRVCVWECACVRERVGVLSQWACACVSVCVWQSEREIVWGPRHFLSSYAFKWATDFGSAPSGPNQTDALKNVARFTGGGRAKWPNLRPVLSFVQSTLTHKQLSTINLILSVLRVALFFYLLLFRSSLERPWGSWQLHKYNSRTLFVFLQTMMKLELVNQSLNLVPVELLSRSFLVAVAFVINQ